MSRILLIMGPAERAKRTQRARALRREASLPERIVWRHLRRRQIANLRFRRQHPIGPYFADFCCVEAKLVIEVDGRAHSGDQWDRDRQRDRLMEGEGYRVIRIPVADIVSNLDDVIAMIGKVGVERREGHRAG